MQKRERTKMGLPVGFQKAYDMVWYFSNYVLFGKELSCHIPTQILMNSTTHTHTQTDNLFRSKLHNTRVWCGVK